MLTMDIMRNIPEVCNTKTPSFEARCSAYVASNGNLESSVIETLHYLSATDFQPPYITRGHQLNGTVHHHRSESSVEEILYGEGYTDPDSPCSAASPCSEVYSTTQPSPPATSLSLIHI